MSREAELLDEIEKRQKALKNMTEVESRLLDKVVEIDDEITAIKAKQKELERIVREKVLNVSSPELKQILGILTHLAQFHGAIRVSGGKITRLKPPAPAPQKSGLLSKFGG